MVIRLLGAIRVRDFLLITNSEGIRSVLQKNTPMILLPMFGIGMSCGKLSGMRMVSVWVRCNVSKGMILKLRLSVRIKNG